ncbi:4-hydroxybenzoate octaprenyltransferase [Rickettsiales bacterium]|nr:4-hydroxybenzoate octaprenyltransferase [Rickettsiales bacterium]MDB2550727.1 4-hydroxybenzoate octaprenyltransferase [Rickettsiales bacterium]
MKKYLELIRFYQPIGFILLFLSSLFGIVFALRNKDFNLEILQISILFLIGSFIMRSAGCIINDIADRDFDKEVARTKDRPITSGQISVKQAIIFLGVLLLIGFLILIQFNKLTIILGFLSLFFVILYPFCKRFTYFPQFILGITFNFSVLMSYSAITNQINFSIILLYLLAVIWTVIYDTIYAFADIGDDQKIGIKSTAIKFSEHPKLILIILGLIKISLLIAIAIINYFSYINFVLILIYLIFFMWQIKKWNINDRKESIKIFKENVINGIIINIILIIS